MVSPAVDFAPFRFSTRELAPSQRLPTWHEVFGRSVSRRLLSALSDQPVDVEMTVRKLAHEGAGSSVGMRAVVQEMSLTAGFTAERTPELLSDGNDDVILHVHRAGHRTVTQLGREAEIGPGEGLLTSNADRSLITLPDPADFFSIGLPRRAMANLVPCLEDAFLRPIAGPGALRLLVDYLDVVRDSELLRAPELRQAIAMHIADLIALALGASRDAAEVARHRGLRAARLRAIKTDIADNLSGAVSAGAIAARHRVTPRYVHKLFESEGMTLSRYVLQRRLACVHRLLSDPRHGATPIATLAYSAGFGDLSTFNREFRQRYGGTPSDVRQAARRG